MPNQFEGNFITTPTKKIAIVVGKFNESVTRNLADGMTAQSLLEMISLNEQLG